MTTKEQRKEACVFYQLMLSMGNIKAVRDLAQVHHNINDRAALLKALDRSTDDQGMVCQVESGMDCDCVKYTHSHVRHRLSLMDEWMALEKAYEYAEGYMHIYFVPPKERPESYSRDLALEAFEDGHPHVVYS